jgi:hypothetical protein
MADDVFQLESELPNIPKLLTKPRPGSPCPRNSRAMVLLCCPGWDTLAVELTSWLRITILPRMGNIGRYGVWVRIV